MSFKSLLLATAVGTTLALAAAPASADAIWVRDGTNNGHVFGAAGYTNLTINVSGTNKNVSAGAFYLQYSTTGSVGPWTNFISYCLEPDEWLGISYNTPVSGTFEASLGSTTEYAGRAEQLTNIIAQYFEDSLTSSIKSAAFQLALWEVAYETRVNGGGNPVFNFANGDFKFTQTGATANAVKAQAQTYLTAATDGPEPGVILRVTNQDLIVTPGTSGIPGVLVPEPATLALFGTALAGLGFAAWRRRKAAA